MSEEPQTPTYFGAPPPAVARSFVVVANAAARARMYVGYAMRTMGTWAKTAERLVRLRLHRRRLDARRRTLQYELGGAAFVEDEALARKLRSELHECVDEREQIDRDARDAITRAKLAGSEERSAVARTEIRAPDMGDPGFEPGTSALSERRSNQLS
jgi:hypothetical protein